MKGVATTTSWNSGTLTVTVEVPVVKGNDAHQLRAGDLVEIHLSTDGCKQNCGTEYTTSNPHYVDVEITSPTITNVMRDAVIDSHAEVIEILGRRLDDLEGRVVAIEEEEVAEAARLIVSAISQAATALNSK
jgi:hypothetical protein